MSKVRARVNDRMAPHGVLKHALRLLLSFIFACTAVGYGSAGEPPRRVVSVFLCTDEYVFRLVPRERIAALSYLAGDRHPVVSTIADEVAGIPLIHQSAEAVLAAKPDLVVLDQGVAPRVRTLIGQAGIPIVEVQWTDSLAGIRKETRRLASALGVPARGEALLEEMEARLAAARARAPRPPVATLLYEPNGYTVASGLTNEVMQAAGLKNVAPSFALTRLGTIAVEELVAKPPELLILNGAPATRDSRAALALHHPALKSLPKRTHVQWLSLSPLLCPGPWSVLVANNLARAAQAARQPKTN